MVAKSYKGGTKMKIVTLGTSGAMPTAERGLACAVLALDKEYIMVDCGEGTTRQYLQTNLKWGKPLTILITHMHSDHISGLLGFLQSMDLMGRTEPVKIYGVRGIEKYLLQAHRNQQVKFGYEFKVYEMTENDTIIGDSFTVTACNSVHSIKPSLAYRIALPDKEGSLDINKAIELGCPDNSPLLGDLKRGKDITLKNGKIIVSSEVVGQPTKGEVICFSGDTRPTDKLKEFYRDADYLIHEATFLEEEKEIALKVKHSTAYEAGLIANQAGVKHVILTHLSARQANPTPILEEASKVNPNVVVAKDLMEIRLD